MSLIRFIRDGLERRCRSRGVTVDAVEPAIARRDDGHVYLDDHHEAYQAIRLGLVQKAVNFTKAAAKHIANRGRQCTNSEIAARYAICEKCPLLVDGHCTHKNCGCAISPKRAIVSKLSWASESCPVGKWSAIPCQDSK